MAKGIMAGGGISFIRGLTATPSDIVSGYTFFGESKKKEDGAIPVKSAEVITPGTSDITLYSGQYLSGIQTVKGDSNLIPQNIRKGVTIFGVTGTFVPVKVVTLGAGSIASIWTDAGTPESHVDVSWMAGTGYPYFTNRGAGSFIANFSLRELIDFSDYRTLVFRGDQNSGQGVFASNIGSTVVRISTDFINWQDVSSLTGRGTISDGGHAITFNLSNVTGAHYLYMSLYMTPQDGTYSWLSTAEFSQ